MHSTPCRKRIWGSLHPFVEHGDIMGRSVANTQFLKELFQQNPYDEYHFFLQNESQCRQLVRWIQLALPDFAAEDRVRVTTRPQLPDALKTTAYHCFHLSDCIEDTASLARVRNLHGCNIFPITGPTHSLSYAWYPSAFLGHMWQGTCARDAVIATSRAAKCAVENIYASLRQAYGLDERYRAPAVALIPLGAHLPEKKDSYGTRDTARKELGLHDESRVVLITGRVSHYSKMDLLPVLRAFQRLFAAGHAPGSITLIVAGWTEQGDTTPDVLSGLARAMGLQLRFFHRPDDQVRDALYRAADIFLSPSDNVQESFGLTVLEAAAAGLPVIASDWNGYRDLVEHEKTGLLVPTLGPADTRAADTAARVVYDNHYHLQLAQQTAVDVPALTAALDLLLTFPEKAKTMGAAGRKRVLEQFTWHSVVRRHIALWDSLAATAVDEQALRAIRHPQQMDYAAIFAGHPTDRLHGGLMLQWSRAGQAVYRGADHPVIYAGVDDRIPRNALHRMLFAARSPVCAANIEAVLVQHCGMTAEDACFLLLWALKQDLLERV